MTKHIYLTGEVRRYHANPRLARLGQTNAAHQWGCAEMSRLRAITKHLRGDAPEIKQTTVRAHLRRITEGK